MTRESGGGMSGVRGLFFLTGYLTLLAAAPARGDVLLLRNGNRIEGRVTVEANGDYRVFMEPGRVVVIPAVDVVDREVREAPIDALERRLREAPAGDRDGLVEIAAFAEVHGLHKSVPAVYRQILQIDPHHSIARERLGYVLYHNRWRTREQLADAGLVRFRGSWKTPEEVRGIKEQEAIQEFEALLADMHHENRYLRENAFYRLLANKDPAIVPHLRELLSGDDALDRMLAARVLGNHPFEVGGRQLYEALRREPRPEVSMAIITVLRSHGDGTIARWAADDLASSTLSQDAVAIDNLFRLAEGCPHRRLIPPLLALLDQPLLRERTLRLLGTIFDRTLRTAVDWRVFWRQQESSVADDLGAGWISAKRRNQL